MLSGVIYLLAFILFAVDLFAGPLFFDFDVGDAERVVIALHSIFFMLAAIYFRLGELREE